MSFLSKAEAVIYTKVLVFGLALFGLFYFYTTKMGIPNVLNKSVADTSIVLIGLSFWISSLSYFFTIFDTLIKYRKHIGLIGFAFGVVHFILSFQALKGLPNPAPLTGVLAIIIFTIMALISNRALMMKIGVARWRLLLRCGYAAVLLILAHVVFLKYARWLTWYNGGLKTLPSSSIIISLFIAVVVVMRLAMWLRIQMKK